MEEEKLKQLKKLQTLQEEPNLAFFDELEDLNNKFEALQSILSEINSKEVKTYEEELNSLQNAIFSLTESVISKDTVVNIPLEQLSAQLVKVEQAIKNIKIEKTEFPTELSLNDTQINELLLAIQSIPEFPYKELEKLVVSIGKKIDEIKLETPEQEEFDYNRLDRKFNELIKAVKNVSITVSGGGGGIDDVSRQNLTNISNNTSSIAGLSIPAHDTIDYGKDIDGNITTVTYKKAGVTVATKTITYVGGEITSQTIL